MHRGSVCYLLAVNTRGLNGTNGVKRKRATAKKRAKNRATAAQQAARLAIIKASGLRFTDDEIDEVRKEMDG